MSDGLICFSLCSGQGRRRAQPGPVAGELGGEQEGQPRRRRRRDLGPARAHGVRPRLADGRGPEHESKVRRELEATPDASSPSSSLPSRSPPGVRPQATSAIPGQRRRSGDSGRPVPGDRWRGRRPLASPPAAAAATEAAARLGHRRRHELAAASVPAAADQRRRRDCSCSIITIPSLRYDARPAGLGSAERVPLAGQTHLEAVSSQEHRAFVDRLPRQRPSGDPKPNDSSSRGDVYRRQLDAILFPFSFFFSSGIAPSSFALFLDWVRDMDSRMDGHVNEEFPRRRRVTGRRRIKQAVYLFAAFFHHWPAPMALGVNITAHFVWSHVASLAARRAWLGKFAASTRPHHHHRWADRTCFHLTICVWCGSRARVQT